MVTNCPNCGSEAVEKFCAHCGQRFHAAHSIREFVRAVADDQLGVDAKLPRTLKYLFFKPGFLTREYMQGRIVRYIPPFRLYLLASVLFFVLLSFYSVRNDWGGEAGRQIAREAGVIDSVAADSGAAAADGRGMSVGVSFDDQQWLHNAEVSLPWKWLEQKVALNLQALGKLPPDVATRRVTSAVIEELPKVMFVMLPVFALLLKILYAFRGRAYIEHFVFALHVHAFVFLLFNSMLIYRPVWLPPLVSIVTAVYTLVAMKRVYEQSFLVTFVKWGALYFCYSILVGVGMVFALIWAFAAVTV